MESQLIFLSVWIWDVVSSENLEELFKSRSLSEIEEVEVWSKAGTFNGPIGGD